MSRLRQAWSLFWYVSRWHHLARMLFILGCGLFLAVGGVILATRPYLPGKPARLDFKQVTCLLEQAAPQYISFEADLDFTKKIYYTGWVPYWVI